MRLALSLAAAAVAASVGVAAMPAVASAETVVPTEKFTGVELHGGGRISIRQGAVQRVTLVDGDPSVVGFDVDSRGRLIIRSCKGFCWGSHHLEVEIVTPDLDGVAIMGGGHIIAAGNFPSKGEVSATIHGGGDIDMRAVPAQAATAAIHGGGKIIVSAQNSLDASIYGGGAIKYAGHPAVNSSIHGGGSVRSLD